MEAIKESLKRNGQFRPVVVNKRRDGYEVLAGNHTTQAARELGWEEIQAHVLQVDDNTARKIMLADNRTSDLATYDLEQLAQELAEVEELEGTGYETADLQAVMDLAADDVAGPAEEYEGVYPYEGTRTIELHLMEPLWEQWQAFSDDFDSPEEALEHLLDHA